MKSVIKIFASALVFAVATSCATAEKPVKKPLKALMITGGCCHDYKAQKDILSKGITERIPVEWEIFYEMNEKKHLEYLSKEGWADGFDFVLYNHCFAHVTDPAFVAKIKAVHKSGKPAVALHCAMHSWHWKIPVEKGEEKDWPTILGASSKGHGPKARITVTKVNGLEGHLVVKDLPNGWVTPQGELYNVQKILGATVLATGENGKAKSPQAVIWVHEFGKSRLFCTTIGHHNETMEAKEYLDMVANGVRWIMGED